MFDENDLSILYELIDKDVQYWEEQGESPDKRRAIRDKLMAMLFDARSGEPNAKGDPLVEIQLKQRIEELEQQLISLEPHPDSCHNNP